jgi:hypothetical protein
MSAGLLWRNDVAGKKKQYIDTDLTIFPAPFFLSRFLSKLCQNEQKGTYNTNPAGFT